MIKLYGDWKSIERMDTHDYDFVICMAEKNFAMEEEANGNCVICRNRLEFNVAYAAYEGKLYDLIDSTVNGNYCHEIRLIEYSEKAETRARYRTVVNNPQTECVPVITNEHNYISKNKYTFPSIIMEKGHAYMVRLKGESEYLITGYRYVGNVCEEERSKNVTKKDGDHLSININADRIELPSIRGITDVRIRSMVPEIDRVTWNGPATVVFWKDGSKTVVKCGDKDDFDKEKGLAMAFMKKILGNKGNYYNYIRKWLPEEKPSSIPNSWIIFNEAVTEFSVEGEVGTKDIYTIKLKNGTKIKCTVDEVPFFMTAIQKFMESHSNSQK